MTAGSILIADHDDAFRESTCLLLEREDYHCESVKGADEAVESLQRTRFDVLVADTDMPGNPDLRVVREARDLDSYMPVILVTSTPSLETMVRVLELSAAAYLTKPVDVERFLGHVRKAAEHSHVRHRLSAVADLLRSVAADLETAKSRPFPRNPASDDIVVAACRILAASLWELLVLSAGPARERAGGNLCELLDCPGHAAQRHAILEAIEVLKKTKTAFKSKALADLRTNLQHVLGIS